MRRRKRRPGPERGAFSWGAASQARAARGREAKAALQSGHGAIYGRSSGQSSEQKGPDRLHTGPEGRGLHELDLDEQQLFSGDRAQGKSIAVILELGGVKNQVDPVFRRRAADPRLPLAEPHDLAVDVPALDAEERVGLRDHDLARAGVERTGERVIEIQPEQALE